MGFTVAIIACIVLCYILWEKVSLLDLEKTIISLQSNLEVVIIVFLLLFLNWGLEGLKWYILIQKIQKLSIAQTVQSLLLGISLALVTPNRIGELGGRLLYVKKENRAGALYYHSFSAITQLIVTILVGCYGMLNFLDFFAELSWLNSSVTQICLALLILFFLIVFFSSNGLNRIMKFWFKNKPEMLPQKIHLKDRITIFTLSIFRYIVFTIQFCLIMRLFEYTIPWNVAFLGVSFVFLLTSIIPTGWISDIPVRTSVAFYVFDAIGYSGINAMMSSIVVWLINLFIPGVVGLIALKKIDWHVLKSKAKW